MRRLAAALLAVLLLALTGTPTPASPQGCQNANLHPNNLPNGQAGQPYSGHLWITPGNPCAPDIWSVTPNPPFPGVNLVPGPQDDEAYIVGTPTTPGTYTFTITGGGIVTCGAVCFQTQTYTVVVL